MSNLVLIDGNGLQWRAAFSMGIEEDGIIKGIFKYLSIIDNKFSPSCMVVFWDTGDSRWRKSAFPKYKEGRSKRDKEIDVESVYEQVRTARKYLEYFGIQSISVNGLEADDLIAMYSSYSQNLFEKICIVTGDKDLWQLVSDKVFVYNHLKNQIIDQHFLVNNFVDAYKIPYLKAISGDSSDKIPGIKGIGEKTAKNLIEDYQINGEFNVRDYKDHFEKSKRLSKILDSFETFETCYRLVSLCKNSDIAYMFNQEEINELVECLRIPEKNFDLANQVNEFLGDYSEDLLRVKNYNYEQFFGIVDIFKKDFENPCRSCSRHLTSSESMVPYIGETLKVLFVTDRPFYSDFGVSFFNDQESDEFNRIIEYLGLSTDQVGLVGSVNCGTDFIKEPELRCCTSRYLRPLIDHYKPEWVVCLGIESFYVLTGKSGKSSELSGQVEGNVICLPKIRDKFLSEIVRINFDYGLEELKSRLGEI